MLNQLSPPGAPFTLRFLILASWCCAEHLLCAPGILQALDTLLLSREPSIPARDTHTHTHTHFKAGAQPAAWGAHLHQGRSAWKTSSLPYFQLLPPAPAGKGKCGEADLKQRREGPELERKKKGLEKSLEMTAVSAGLGKTAQRARGCVGGRALTGANAESCGSREAGERGPERCLDCKPEPQGLVSTRAGPSSFQALG